MSQVLWFVMKRANRYPLPLDFHFLGGLKSGYVAPLLEMTLSFLAAEANNRSPWDDASLVGGGGGGSTTTTMTVTSTSTTTTGMDLFAFARSLGGALRRGCHGAPAEDWGSAILSIVASLPDCRTIVAIPREEGIRIGDVNEGMEDDGEGNRPITWTERQTVPISVVSSLWDGRKCTAGIVDKSAIVLPPQSVPHPYCTNGAIMIVPHCLHPGPDPGGPAAVSSSIR